MLWGSRARQTRWAGRRVGVCMGNVAGGNAGEMVLKDVRAASALRPPPPPAGRCLAPSPESLTDRPPPSNSPFLPSNFFQNDNFG